MIRKINKDERYYSQQDWLSTYHLFSFANYYDPTNLHFGLLRVFNDDTIAEHSGFGAHSHRDMEIITIVLDGELTHQDSMGNVGTIKAGEVQYMSAGSGVTHSEKNDSDTPVHLYQIWLLPEKNSLPPNYSQKDFSHVSNKNILLPVISNKENGNAIQIKSDVQIFTSHLESDKNISLEIEKDRGVFVYVQEGSIEISGVICEAGDQLRIEDESSLNIKAIISAKFILIDTVL